MAPTTDMDRELEPAGTVAPVMLSPPVVSPRGSGGRPESLFLAEARRHRRLDDAEERELARRAREDGDLDAARRLALHNLRIVVRVAYEYRRAWGQLLDLLQEGTVGLLLAVKRWEPALGARFGTYARHWIRAYVLHFILVNARMVHVGSTRAGRKLFFRLEDERQRLLAVGFDPSPKLLAARLELPEAEVEAVAAQLDAPEVALDVTPGPGEGIALAERIPDAQDSPEERAAGVEMAAVVRQAMASFEAGLQDERERAVWELHLATDAPLPLAEIGERYGVSKQRMGQIAGRLKERFRTDLTSRLGSDVELAWLAAA